MAHVVNALPREFAVTATPVFRVTPIANMLGKAAEWLNANWPNISPIPPAVLIKKLGVLQTWIRLLTPVTLVQTYKCIEKFLEIQ